MHLSGGRRIELSCECLNGGGGGGGFKMIKKRDGPKSFPFFEKKPKSFLFSKEQ